MDPASQRHISCLLVLWLACVGLLTVRACRRISLPELATESCEQCCRWGGFASRGARCGQLRAAHRACQQLTKHCACCRRWGGVSSGGAQAVPRGCLQCARPGQLVEVQEVFEQHLDKLVLPLLLLRDSHAAADGIASPAEGPKQYRAAAFNAPDLDGSMKRGPLAMRNEQDREFESYNRGREINYWGCMVFILYILAFGFYLWVRITKTLDLAGYLWCAPAAIQHSPLLSYKPSTAAVSRRVQADTLAW